MRDHVNSLICPIIELVPDFMSVLITCKSDEHLIKNKIAIIWKYFSKSMGTSRAGNFHANSRNWAKRKVAQAFVPVLVICKFDEYLIKNEVTIVQTTFFPLYVYGKIWLLWKPKFWPDLIQNLIQSIPHPNDSTCEICSRLTNWPWRYSCLTLWTHGWMGARSLAMLQDHLLSLRLRWANNIGNFLSTAMACAYE